MGWQAEAERDMKPFSQWLSAGRPQSNLAQTGAELIQAFEQELGMIIEEVETSVALEQEAIVLSRVSTLQFSWQDAAASDYKRKLSQSIDSLQQRLIDSVSKAIEPLLTESLVEKGIEQFCDVLHRYLGKSPCQEINVLTPAGMRETIERHFSSRSISAEVRETDTPEIRATIGPTEIETDLRGWVENLRKTAA
jgi:non-ribosomal peptide synthetase component F